MTRILRFAQNDSEGLRMTALGRGGDAGRRGESSVATGTCGTGPHAWGFEIQDCRFRVGSDGAAAPLRCAT